MRPKLRLPSLFLRDAFLICTSNQGNRGIPAGAEAKDERLLLGLPGFVLAFATLNPPSLKVLSQHLRVIRQKGSKSSAKE
jgi:hypothetical protein